MPRRSWVYAPDGRVFEKGTPEHEAYLGEKYAGPMVFGDETEFRSPIDGKVYSGKAGMREHNKRHDVVNNRDLVGLQVGFDPNKATPETTRQRADRREAIYQSALRGKYLEGQ